jgi:hypothetical protein
LSVRSLSRGVAAVCLTAAATVSAQPRPTSSLRLLDVPYIQQSEALCGGAAAAMIMRYWGATGIQAESFAALVDETAGGIHAADLLEDLRARGWQARSFRGDHSLVSARLADGQPLVALIEDRPGYFHFVVIVAWANGRVVLHDPARAPFRVADEQAFDAAWAKSDRWTLLALPPAGGLPAPADDRDNRAGRAPSSPCDGLVAEGVRTSATGDRVAALGILMTAAEVCPSASGPLREAAGVRALEENWAEAGRLARAAVDRDPADAHAWRILATSAYVTGDAAAALEAWNRAGEPTIDLVTVQGLDRTRHAVAAGLLGLTPDMPLSARALAAAGRRLADLPAAEAARVNYRPLGGGRANVEAVIIERPRLPISRRSVTAIALRAVTDREVAASAASLTGGGERLTAAWRWWENRPRLGISYAAPSAHGVWHVELSGEKQTYGGPAGIVESRHGGALALSNWTSTLARWEIGASLDSWRDRGRTASVRVSVDQRLDAGRISLRAHGSVLGGAFTAATGGLGAGWRSAVRHGGTVLLADAGLEVASDEAPLALWSGAGTGHARGPLLRAHPLLDDGRVAGDVFGRRVSRAGAEGRHWLKPVMKVVRIAPAVFLDVARATDRRLPGGAWHADAGAGLRLALPGSGVVRLDVAKGLRDGATVVSVGWHNQEP